MVYVWNKVKPIAKLATVVSMSHLRRTHRRQDQREEQRWPLVADEAAQIRYTQLLPFATRHQFY